MSELLPIAAQELQHSTFIDLLSEPRAFHDSLRPGERFCDGQVIEHTDDLSVVAARNSREHTRYLVIHNLLDSGILLRRIDVMATLDGAEAHEAAVLVATVGDSKYVPDRTLPVFDRNLSAVGHDLANELAAFRLLGQKLNEIVAKEWLEMIRKTDGEHSRISMLGGPERQSRIGMAVGRLFGRHRTSDTRP